MVTPFWPLWRALTRLFPTYSVIWEGLLSPGALSMVGNDFVSGFRKNRTTIKALALTADLSDDAFGQLCRLAEINFERQTSVFRAFAVIYFSVPLTIVATVSQMDSAAVTSFLAWATARPAYIAMACGVALNLPVLFTGVWRARQMRSVLQIAAIEQGRPPPV